MQENYYVVKEDLLENVHLEIKELFVVQEDI